MANDKNFRVKNGITNAGEYEGSSTVTVTNGQGFRHRAPATASGQTAAHLVRTNFTAENNRWYLVPEVSGSANFSREFTFNFDTRAWAIEGQLQLPDGLLSTSDIYLTEPAPFIHFTETGVTNTPEWWVGADGGTFSIRLNNTGAYPLSINTSGSNETVTEVTFGYYTTAPRFRATAVGVTNGISESDVEISGYGMLGSRAAAPVYVTNEDAGGVRIGSSGAHGNAKGMIISHSATTVQGTDFKISNSTDMLIGNDDFGGLQTAYRGDTAASKVKIDGGSEIGLFVYNDAQNGKPAAVFYKNDDANNGPTVIIAGDADNNQEHVFEVRGQVNGTQISLSSTSNTTDTLFAVSACSIKALKNLEVTGTSDFTGDVVMDQVSVCGTLTAANIIAGDISISGGTTLLNETHVAASTVSGLQASDPANSFIMWDSANEMLFHKQISTVNSPLGPSNTAGSIINATNNTVTMLANVSHVEGHVTGATQLTLSFGDSKIGVSASTSNVGSLDIKANSITADEIKAGSLRADTLSVLARNFVNPVSSTATLAGWGGVEEDVEGVGSQTHLAYSAAEDALEITSSNGSGFIDDVAVWSDSWLVDPNKIYRFAYRVKHSNTTGAWYSGLRASNFQFKGEVLTNGGGGGAGTFTEYNSSRTASSATNVYFVQGTGKSTAYRSYVSYIIGANRNIEDVPDHEGTQNFPYIKMNSTQSSFVAVRFLNWNSGTTVESKMFIADMSVTEIGTGTIVADNIKANAITSDKITASAITGDKIQGSSITTTKLRASIIDASKIQAGAITVDKLGASSITAAKLRANVINASKIAASTITAQQLSSSIITARQIQALAIETGKLAASAITGDKIQASAITAIKIQAGAITVDKLGASSITSAKLRANVINASKIAASTITADQLASSSITTTKLRASIIDASKIQASAITAGKIQASAVTAGKIQASAVTADKIQSSAITATKIQSLTITGNKIAGNTISGNKLFIGDLTNHVRNPRFDDVLDWSGGGIAEVTDSTWGTAGRLVANGSVRDGLQPAPYIPVTPSDKFYTEIQVRTDGSGVSKSSSGNVNIQFGWFEYGQDGTTITNYTNISRSAGFLTSSWQELTGVVTLQPDTYFIRPWVSVREGVASGNVYWTNFLVRKQSKGTLIEDDAITTGKITASAITSDKIQASAITAVKIQASAITAIKIQAGAITVDKLGASSITAAKLRASIIDATKIQASAITAGKIQAGAITANKIASSSITATRLSSSIITARQIASSAITTTKLRASIIDASKIQASAITAGKIQAGAITVDKLGASSITAAKLRASIIDASKIQASAITAGKIQASAITAGKIQAGAISADKIASSTITATRLSSSIITARQISSSTITANKLTSSTITARQISSSTITARQMSANSISARQLAVSSDTSGSSSMFFDGANNRIDIKDSSGTLRVRIGNLA